MWSWGRSRWTGKGAVARRARLALVFASLFAVLLQALVVQTHIHGPVVPASLGVEHQPAAAHHSQAALVQRGHQIICATCQTLASSGAATLADAAAAELPRSGRLKTRLAFHAAARATSHSWRSRAPPVRLRA